MNLEKLFLGKNKITRLEVKQSPNDDGGYVVMVRIMIVVMVMTTTMMDDDDGDDGDGELSMACTGSGVTQEAEAAEHSE